MASGQTWGLFGVGCLGWVFGCGVFGDTAYASQCVGHGLGVWGHSISAGVWGHSIRESVRRTRKSIVAEVAAVKDNDSRRQREALIASA
jgi:hypothetical protein